MNSQAVSGDPPPELRGRDIWVSFGGAVALQDVTISLHSDEAVAVLGRNGAGKTTLLRTLVGLIKPERGRVERRCQELRGARDAVNSGIRFVPESANVFADMLVVENLFSAVPWLRRRDREMRVAEVIGLLPVLAPLLKRRAGQLSGGERQALAVGRAVMAKPEVLVLDEPTLGLAPRLAEGLMDVLRGLRSQGGMAILIAEQSSALTSVLCDRSISLDVGRVVLGDADV